MKYLVLVLALSCTASAIPLQDRNEEGETTDPSIILQDQTIRPQEDSSLEDIPSISFCSPACAESIVNPCGSSGECDDGHECCLDLCLSSTVCRPIGPAVPLYQPKPSIVHGGNSEDEREGSGDNGEEKKESADEYLENPEENRDDETSITSELKRNAQYDALTYGMSPEEYHKTHPQDGYRYNQDSVTSSYPVEAEAEQEEEEGEDDEYRVTAPTPTEETSDLFSSRNKRSPQDETGGFPHVPVTTFELSDARDRIAQTFQDIKTQISDHFSDDDDDDNDDGGNNATNNNEKTSDSDHTDQIPNNGNEGLSSSQNSGITRDMESQNPGTADGQIPESNEDTSLNKRSPQLTPEVQAGEGEQQPGLPPTIVFVKKVPGVSLKELVDSGEASITKIISPVPMDLPNMPLVDEVSDSEDLEDFLYTTTPPSEDTEEGDSTE